MKASMVAIDGSMESPTKAEALATSHPLDAPSPTAAQEAEALARGIKMHEHAYTDGVEKTNPDPAPAPAPVVPAFSWTSWPKWRLLFHLLCKYHPAPRLLFPNLQLDSTTQ